MTSWSSSPLDSTRPWARSYEARSASRRTLWRRSSARRSSPRRRRVDSAIGPPASVTCSVIFLRLSEIDGAHPAGAVVLDGLPDLGGRVHDERPVAGDRLAERGAG